MPDPKVFLCDVRRPTPADHLRRGNRDLSHILGRYVPAVRCSALVRRRLLLPIVALAFLSWALVAIFALPLKNEIASLGKHLVAHAGGLNIKSWLINPDIGSKVWLPKLVNIVNEPIQPQPPRFIFTAQHIVNLAREYKENLLLPSTL